MQRAGIWFAVAAVLALAVISAVLLARPVDPFSLPGTSWTRGLLSGQTIRLLQSGRYASVRWCDVCEKHPSFGRWRVVEDGYELVPDSGAPSEWLLRTQYLGCLVLAPRGLTPPAEPEQFYRRVGDRCQDELHERESAAGVTERQALEISRKAASMHGYDLRHYALDTFGDRTLGGKETWMFVYLCTPWPSPPGCHFLVTVDRRTGSVTVTPGR